MKILKPFIVFFIIFTIALVPAQFALGKLAKIQIFDGETVLEDELNYDVLVKDGSFFDDFEDSERINVLLLGLNDNMSDTIMLGSYDIENQEVDVISIPRDTYYKRDYKPRGANQKINAVYSSEGIVATAKAVSEVLNGIHINYYAIIDYDGVESVVDSMGGVPMDVPFAMRYIDKYDTPPLNINVPKGEQVLTGEKAMEFLRFRKSNVSGYSGYPTGDIGRIAAHQEFMKAAVSQAIGLSLPKVVKTFMESVESDLNVGVAVKVASKAVGLDRENINTYTVPGDGDTIDGLSFWVTDQDKIDEMLTEMYTRHDVEDVETAEE